MIQQDNAVRRGLEALRHRYAQNLPGRAAALRTHVETLLAGDAAEGGWHEAHRLAHSLAGSSGTHRFAEVSATARELESLASGLVEPPPVANPGAVPRIRELLDALAACAEDARLSVAS